MSSHEKIAERVFADDVEPIEAIERARPARAIDGEQWVTRMAPSPTGFVHLGAIYMGLINYLLAQQTKGVSLLRIEDTDQQREVENGQALIMSAFERFGINFDEGPSAGGDYGPYVQSERRTIYRSYAKHLLAQDKAYLCFCSSEDLDQIRETQRLHKVRTGYYGKYARCCNLTPEEVEANLDAGQPYTIRMRATGDYDNRINAKDLARGKLSAPQNDVDTVIIKSSDGLPTYHFAHVIDDHLMGITHVVRGDEWISSLPLHLDLHYILGWKAPKYAHMAPIQKMEDTTRRKLSKRKDPESDINFFLQEGYPTEAIIEYLLTLVNSTFEEWRKANPKADRADYQIDLKKVSNSGALFDFDKLNNISKRIISDYSNIETYDAALRWAQTYNQAFSDLLTGNDEYVKAILNVEKANKNRRKDISHWAMLEDDIAFYFDDKFSSPDVMSLGFEAATVKTAIESFVALLDEADDRNAWWDKVKTASDTCNFSSDMKKYKQAPDEFNGSIADFVSLSRFAITGRKNTPDIYEIMHVLGFDKVKARLATALATLG